MGTLTNGTPTVEEGSATWRQTINQIAALVDAGLWSSGAAASRPVAVNGGAWYYSTDTEVIEYDGAAGWVQIAALTKSGSQSPTLVAVTNCTGTPTGSGFWYVRVGNVVTVFGRVSVTAASAALVEFDIPLPVASDLGAATDLTGVVTPAVPTVFEPGIVVGEPTGDKARVQVYALTTDASYVHVSFAYAVI